MSLYSNHYQSAERTFQLLSQACGRAGRGREKGEVVIQTYNPEHYSIQTAARQDYESFYEEEMNYRMLMGYPPAEELLAIWMTGQSEEHLKVAAGYLKEFTERINREGRLTASGPAAPYVSKVNDQYRQIIYVKSEDYELLVRTKDLLEQYIDMNRGFDQLRIQFDFNPLNI